MHFGAQMRKELSRKFPVLDNLEGIAHFIETTKQEVIDHPTSLYDMFVIGESGAGKGTIAEELLKRLAEDPDIRRKYRRKNAPTWKYYSLAMGLMESYAEGLVSSPWGEFTPEEFSRATRHMAERLDTSEDFPRPLIRVIEAVAICEPPLNLGAELIRRAPQRAANDPDYLYKVIGIATTKKVQKRAEKVREGFAQSNSQEDIRETLRRNRMKPDANELDDVLAIQRSVGNKFAMDRINGIDNANMVALQEKLRQIDRRLPEHMTEQMFQENDILRSQALAAYIMCKLQEWGVPEDRAYIAENPILPKRTIPYLRRYIVTHKL